MPTRLLSSLTAARWQQAIRRADSAATTVDRRIVDWWRGLLRLIHAAPTLGPHRLYAQSLRHFRALPAVARGSLADSLADILRWGHRTAAENVVRAVPVKWLRTAYAKRAAHQSDSHAAALSRLFSRSHGSGGRRRTPEPAGRGIVSESARHLSQRAPHDHTGLDDVRSARIAVAELIEGPLATLSLTPSFDFRADSPLDALSADATRHDLMDLLFPPLPEQTVRERVYRLIAPFLAAPRPDLVPPERLADILIQGYSQGKTQQEIAKDLLPHVDRVKASARRVARTWGIAIAHDSQMQAHAELGDLVTGYQIFSALVTSTRPWHRERHRTIYYRNPGPGQKGFYQLPHPPREAADQAERPLGTPSIAWN